jgi:hypothetical protein
VVTGAMGIAMEQKQGSVKRRTPSMQRKFYID